MVLTRVCADAHLSLARMLAVCQRRPPRPRRHPRTRAAEEAAAAAAAPVEQTDAEKKAAKKTKKKKEKKRKAEAEVEVVQAREQASAVRGRADAIRGQAGRLRAVAIDARVDKLDERADKLATEAKELDERADKLAAEADKLDERGDKLAAEAKEAVVPGSALFETTDGDKKFLESLMSPQWKVLGGGVADLVDEHGRLMLTLDSLLERALETRDALVADKPSNLNHSMVLQLAMASPHVLLPDERTASPLFVREEQLYVAGLIEEHRRSEDGAVVICIGSPGIGKSFSLLFLLHMYVRRARPWSSSLWS